VTLAGSTANSSLRRPDERPHSNRAQVLANLAGLNMELGCLAQQVVGHAPSRHEIAHTIHQITRLVQELALLGTS
jgi:hypothetical protein